MEDWTVRDGVYAPREDSRLMAEVLEDRDFAGKTVLDIGTGSGILAYTALRQGADAVTAVDINPDALDNTRENLTAHGIDSDRFTLIRSDLFNAIEELFDVILFNPPYVPGEGELETMEEQSWAGGEQGREVTDRFLDMYTDYLADDGDVFLLQSSRNDIEQTLDRFQEQGCETAVVAEEKVPWEKLVVIRATLQ